MIIKQLSAFIENKTGRLYAAADTLAKNGINISALSLADTSEFGIVRLLVDDPEKGKQVLADSGVTVRITHVVALAMDDTPGGAVEILKTLAENNLSVEYMYACVGRQSGKALMVLRASDNTGAEEALHKAGFNDIDPRDIYRIEA